MVIGGKWGRMESAPRQNSSTGSSRASYYSPLSVSPHLSPKGGPGYSPYSPGYSPAGSALTPVYSTPLTPIDNNYFEVYEHGHDRKRDSQGDIHVTKQEHRANIEQETAAVSVKMCDRVIENWVQRIDPCERAPSGHMNDVEFHTYINVLSIFSIQ
ncbi:unnamed protein product [Acanthoscelides obtectus]|uniref:Uncharacterized protein n=1 Tax=Acanthoscelides obtectus TaxID=200917 RepID=A0A9P0P7Z4_ACAOB|nr:unnamed protein product [Acanthoscelides obtectus]CAK1654518.1 hypothetical protein AOBTE_LOCUS18651 [Acanthoscelides obtectus]